MIFKVIQCMTNFLSYTGHPNLNLHATKHALNKTHCCMTTFMHTNNTGREHCSLNTANYIDTSSLKMLQILTMLACQHKLDE